MTTPHRSTTHDEKFFHITGDGEDNPGTAFFRKETDGWYGVAAVLAPCDQFSRRIGRTVSRRRYFQAPDKRTKIINIGLAPPTYDNARALVARFTRA